MIDGDEMMVTYAQNYAMVRINRTLEKLLDVGLVDCWRLAGQLEGGNYVFRRIQR